MADITFDLPLDPRHHFTSEALEQMAGAIIGTPIRLADNGGQAKGEIVGKVISAQVMDDRVAAEAEVDDLFASLIGGYGLDAVVRKVGDEFVSISRTAVVGLAMSALPDGARRPVWRRG